MSFERTYAFAIGYATGAHAGMVRKYTGEPYVDHTIAVAKAVAADGGMDRMVVAALLHDTIEDTSTTHADLVAVFGSLVADLVLELTDEYTTEKYPTWNRAFRKTLEAVRLGKVSNEAKIIKRADMADNTASIVEHDAKFAKVYLAEKEAVLKAIA